MTLAAVLDQMLAAGMPMPDELRVTGRIERYGKDGRHRKSGRAWYVLRWTRTRGGTEVVTGAFGEWGYVDATRVAVDWRGIGAEEREAIRQQQAAQQAAEAARRERLAAHARLQAADLWASARRDVDSEYLRRKSVEPEPGLRQAEDGAVLVPMIRYDLAPERALVGVQRITADGVKRFVRGTAKRGAACRLGLVDTQAPILICEGLATGLTLRMATARRVPVFVAFDAGNLAPVAEILRALFPRQPLLVCADDDAFTDGNPGRTYARQVVRAVRRTHLIYPVFTAARGRKHTDFNDLHALQGLGAVARQLAAPLSWLAAPETATRERAA